jgi:hypothetical protein
MGIKAVKAAPRREMLPVGGIGAAGIGGTCSFGISARAVGKVTQWAGRIGQGRRGRGVIFVGHSGRVPLRKDIGKLNLSMNDKPGLSIILRKRQARRIGAQNLP